MALILVSQPLVSEFHFRNIVEMGHIGEKYPDELVRLASQRLDISIRTPLVHKESRSGFPFPSEHIAAETSAGHPLEPDAIPPEAVDDKAAEEDERYAQNKARLAAWKLQRSSSSSTSQVVNPSPSTSTAASIPPVSVRSHHAQPSRTDSMFSIKSKRSLLNIPLYASPSVASLTCDLDLDLKEHDDEFRTNGSIRPSRGRIMEAIPVSRPGLKWFSKEDYTRNRKSLREYATECWEDLEDESDDILVRNPPECDPVAESEVSISKMVRTLSGTIRRTLSSINLSFSPPSTNHVQPSSQIVTSIASSPHLATLDLDLTPRPPVAASLRPVASTPNIRHLTTTPFDTDDIAPLDEVSAAVEASSALNTFSTCVICGKQGMNYASCPRCKDVFCSRDCRVTRAGDGNKHVCGRHRDSEAG